MPVPGVIRYSHRVPDDFTPNPLSRALAERRHGVTAPDGLTVCDLTVSNPTEVGLSPTDPEVQEILARAAAGPYRPEPAGLRSAREAVASYYAARGVTIDPDQVVLTTSTSEAYAHIFRLLGDAGDSFLVPRPSYPLFEPLAALEAVRLDPYPLHYDGRWWLDREALAAAVHSRTRGVILVEPNNPTGSCLSPEEAESVEELAAAHGLPLAVDEVFGDFVTDGTPRRATWAAGGPGLTFVLSGLSKVCGLPQLKLGWIVVAGPAELRAPALQRLEWVTDTFLAVGTPVQHALPELLPLRHAFQARVGARVAENHALLAGLAPPGGPLEVLALSGGWTVLVRLPRLHSEEAWCLRLLQAGVLVHPGHFYDCGEEAWVALSLLPRPETFARGARRLLELVRAS